MLNLELISPSEKSEIGYMVVNINQSYKQVTKKPFKVSGIVFLS